MMMRVKLITSLDTWHSCGVLEFEIGYLGGILRCFV